MGGFGQPSTRKMEDELQLHRELLEAQRELLVRQEARLDELVKMGNKTNELLFKILQAIATRP